MKVASSLVVIAVALAVNPAGGADFPGEVEATGQTTCEDQLGDPVDCTGTGQDGDLRAGVDWPVPRFTVNGDGTVTDNLTGLIWLRDATCADLAGTDAEGRGDWQTALDAANGLAAGVCGLSDGSTAGSWRLPNANEASSLVAFLYGEPHVPSTIGDGVMSEGEPFIDAEDASFWVSTTWAADPIRATFMQVHSGTPGLSQKTTLRHVWPVRGSTTGARAPVERTGQVSCYSQAGAPVACAGTGQDGDHLAGAPWPSPRFVDNGDGTVNDQLTGLIWLKDATCAELGGTDGRLSWGDAVAACRSLAHGTCGLADSSSAGEWRLPNVKELLSLVDYEYESPALSNGAGTGQWAEGDVFTGVLGWDFWTSTSMLGWSPPQALQMSVGSGLTSLSGKGYVKYVWPVRGGQLPVIFADGFELGSTAGWSVTTP